MKKILLNRVRPNGKPKQYALVDDEDYEFLNQFSWHLNALGYVAMGCKHSRKIITMHRYMACLCDPKVFVDHADGNGLNNQKSNLRPCSMAQNQMNKKPRGASKYLGVARNYKKWRAAIAIKGNLTHLGLFDNEIAAAMVYDAAAIIHHGEFARLNFPKRNLTNPK